LELRAGAWFPLEPFDEVSVARVLLVEDLQRDVALEQRVVRPVDARHPARPDELLELVAVRNPLADHGPNGTRAEPRVCGFSAGGSGNRAFVVPDEEGLMATAGVAVATRTRGRHLLRRDVGLVGL